MTEPDPRARRFTKAEKAIINEGFKSRTEPKIVADMLDCSPVTIRTWYRKLSGNPKPSYHSVFSGAHAGRVCAISGCDSEPTEGRVCKRHADATYQSNYESSIPLPSKARLMAGR